MRINYTKVLIAVAITMALAVWIRGFWFTEVFAPHKNNEVNRAALLKIRDAVPLGASHHETLAAYWNHRSDSLVLSADSPAIWIIRMPLEFGATDWNLRFEFLDGKVVAIKVRTADGPPPKEGPEDKRQ